VPFTPFHFGPGAALHALAPRRVSFLAFCGANILIDVEPLYFMLTGQDPLHRFFHTVVGATLVAAVTVAIFILAKGLARRVRLPDALEWQGLRAGPVACGAFAGTYSHVVLDSVMHWDMKPFAPFSNANPLLHFVSVDALQWACFGAGLFGAAVLGARHWLRGRTPA
jgi:hypothetical protein